MGDARGDEGGDSPALWNDAGTRLALRLPALKASWGPEGLGGGMRMCVEDSTKLPC